MSPNEESFWIVNTFGEKLLAKYVTPTQVEKKIRPYTKVLLAAGIRRTSSEWGYFGFYPEQNREN